MKKIFFNSSLPRSGSTLFQNIVAQNPEFYVTPTSGVLELIYGARANFTNSPEFKAQDNALMEKAFISFCREGMEGFYSAVTDRQHVLDKSRGWGIYYDLLKSVLGHEPKIVCMVRDLRQILSSLEKKFRQNPLKANSMVDWSKMQNTTTGKRVTTWLNSPPVGIALERLHQIILEGKDKKILFIRFEDLTSNPAKELARFYNYIELPHLQFAHDFNNVAQVTQEDDDVYGVFGDHVIRSKVEPLKKDYLDVLGKPICDVLADNVSWYFKYFGYA